MIIRERLLKLVWKLLNQFPVVLITGPRQCGKTTLAKQVLREMEGHFFDLENPQSPLRPEVAMTILSDLKGLIVIDEFQHQPKLFELIRVLADRDPIEARFLILGSASPKIVKGASESLAGRVAYLDMGGLLLDEVGGNEHLKLWERGGFPNAYLADSDEQSFEWREQFITSFLERDLPQLGVTAGEPRLRRFWRMLAHFQGKLWNAADFGRALTIKPEKARYYLDILTGAFVVRQLPPWFENVGKQLVKSPKIYFRDTGLLHALLGFKNRDDVLSYPYFGFSWEGFVVEQVVQLFRAERNAFFYKAYSGAELDLLIVRGNDRIGFEFKCTDSPSTTKSMHVVIEDLGLKKLQILYPGTQRYHLTEKIEVCPIAELPSLSLD